MLFMFLGSFGPRPVVLTNGKPPVWSRHPAAETLAKHVKNWFPKGPAMVNVPASAHADNASP